MTRGRLLHATAIALAALVSASCDILAGIHEKQRWMGDGDAAADGTTGDAADLQDAADGADVLDVTAAADATDAGAATDSGSGAEGAADSGPTDASLHDAEAGSAPDASDASGAPPDAGLDAPADVTVHDSGSPTGGVRVTHLVPDLGAAVDFCVAAQGGAFDGPYLASVGVAGGLSYSQVSERVPGALPLKIRAVAAGAADCSSALAGVADLTISSGATGRWTVALIGSTAGGSAPPPALVSFVDDVPPVSPAYTAETRLIHAAPASGSLDVVLGGGSFATPQQTGLVFGAETSSATRASGGLAVDLDGYIQLVDNDLFTVRRGATDLLGLPINTFSGTTAFIAGLESGGYPLELVVCDEGAAPVAHLWPCTVSTSPPTMYPVRIGNLSPAASIDVCIGQNEIGVSALAGPLLAQSGLSGGAGYLQLTDVVALVPGNAAMVMQLITAGGSCGGGYLTQDGFPGAAFDFVMVQSAFGASPQYRIDLPTEPPAVAGVANLELSNFVAEPSPESVDMFATPSGGTEVQLGTTVGASSAAQYVTLSGGSYSLRVADHATATTVYSKTGVSLPVGSRFELSWIHDATGHGTLATCNLALPGSGNLTTCSN